VECQPGTMPTVKSKLTTVWTESTSGVANPASSSELMAQTATFSQVEQLQNIATQNTSLLALQRSLSAGALVGQTVSYTDSTGVPQVGVVSSVTIATDTDPSMATVNGVQVDVGRPRAFLAHLGVLGAHLDSLGVNIPDVNAEVATLSGGQRQAIAVARTVNSDADIILLDEPLAAMGAKEGAMILDLVARLRAEGRVSIIMIAHNYVHVLQSCDRVNLIQGGEITFDKPTADTSVEELNELVVEEYRRARRAAQSE